MRSRFPWSLKRLVITPALAIGFLALVFAAPGCETNPITGRKSLNLIPESQTNELGATTYQQLLSESKLSTNREFTGTVAEVGRRIAEVTNRRMAADKREQFEWEFKVIDDPETVNAFCLPGGKVAFYTGILPICKNANGVAVVMGHEIAHAYAEHGNSRMSTQLLGNLSLQAVSAALASEFDSDVAQTAAAALGVGYAVGVQLPFSRADEADADRTGLILMAEAGYDPREAVAFWKRMQEATGGSSQPSFLSTHPGTGDRIKDLEEHLPQAYEIYQRSGSAGGSRTD